MMCIYTCWVYVSCNNLNAQVNINMVLPQGCSLAAGIHVCTVLNFLILVGHRSLIVPNCEIQLHHT
jgi:hypothetical protein